MYAMQTIDETNQYGLVPALIDMDQLALVAGGQGAFERLGAEAGEAAGRWGARQLPQAWRPLGEAVLPPAGRGAGGYAGRWVDRWLSR
jgi:hypothetical protein